MRGRRAIVPTLMGVALAVSVTVPGGAYPRPGRTEIVSVSTDGIPKTAEVASISATGRYIAFVSADRTIVIPDLNTGSHPFLDPGYDVFVHDRKTGGTELVSISSRGEQGIALDDCAAVIPAVSADGRYVAFVSNASNLVPNDNNDLPDVFVRDRSRGETTLVSVSSEGKQQNAAYCEVEEETYQLISMSTDGRYVAWVSPATNLVRGDKNDVSDVFVHDRKTGRTELVSVGSDGTQTERTTTCAVLSSAGRHVGFVSRIEGRFGAFVHDRRTKKTDLISVASDGSQGRFPGALDCLPERPTLSVSASGRYVAFASLDDELIPSDQQCLGCIQDSDVFVHDRKTGRTERVSVGSHGEEATGGWSQATSISADGRFIAFSSDTTNLHPDDDETVPPVFGDMDVFIHDRLTGATELMSVTPDGRDGSCEFADALVPALNGRGEADTPSLSASGRYVAFTSCDTNLVENPNPVPEVLTYFRTFVRDWGPRLGVGHVVVPGGGNGLAIPGERRFDQIVVVRAEDELGDTLASVDTGADLLAATLAYRPHYSDLYLKIDLDRMPGPRGSGLAGNPAMVYGARFSVGDRSYEVRAHKGLNEPVFGLFDCTETCSEVAKLMGGYGTVGESVVATIPLEAVGLAAGGTIEDLEAFSAFGSYVTGPMKVSDTVAIK